MVEALDVVEVVVLAGALEVVVDVLLGADVVGAGVPAGVPVVVVVGAGDKEHCAAPSHLPYLKGLTASSLHAAKQLFL